MFGIFTKAPKEDPTKLDRDLSKLYPPFKAEIDALLAACHSSGVMLYVFEAFRSESRQNFLYAQGRTKPGKIVTNAQYGYSFHNYGLAVDLVFDGDDGKAGIQWSWSGEYKKLGTIVKKYPKLEWAGTWKSFKEMPHVQLKLPYTAVQLKALYDEKQKSLTELWKVLEGVK